MKVIINEKEGPIEVESSMALVEYMNAHAKWRSGSPSQYMLDFAKRAVVDQNIDIRATDYDAFVEDLAKYNFIKIFE